ncbi:substrate-binding domain-containing protein [Embleya sp. NPDC050493]|uniref:substrate-binding domain-containing protein n=1 Tax=Embleya sp. NPDC050493 TaxID=3363989 RepID=UPI0037A20361
MDRQNRQIRGLSSMATRQILAELAEHIGQAHGIPVDFEAGGGVAIAQRVRDGAAGDVAVLAEGALAKLAAEGHVLAATVRPLWVSQVVAAVPSGAPVPALAGEADLRAALLGARRIAYSTGPSGTALIELIARLGLADTLGDRLVQAPPGVPVGTLLTSGQADLALQQHSELMDLPGVFVVGPLPGETAIASTFSGAVMAASDDPESARTVLDLLGSAAGAAIARARGMRAVSV